MEVTDFFQINPKIQNMKKAIEVFNEWATVGRDEGMKKNHFPAFKKIKKIIKTKYCDQEKLTIGDFGCGNGWATDNLMNESIIDLAIGYDGSEEMIYKARQRFSKPMFKKTNLNHWREKKQFNIIYSMEFLYYLEDPKTFICSTCDKNLKDNGMFIAGIDHYLENKSSLKWSKDLNVKMQTKKIEDWKNYLKIAGLRNIKHKQVNQKENWNGTLIFYGQK